MPNGRGLLFAPEDLDAQHLRVHGARISDGPVLLQREPEPSEALTFSQFIWILRATKRELKVVISALISLTNPHKTYAQHQTSKAIGIRLPSRLPNTVQHPPSLVDYRANCFRTIDTDGIIGKHTSALLNNNSFQYKIGITTWRHFTSFPWFLAVSPRARKAFAPFRRKFAYRLMLMFDLFTPPTPWPSDLVEDPRRQSTRHWVHFDVSVSQVWSCRCARNRRLFCLTLGCLSHAAIRPWARERAFQTL